VPSAIDPKVPEGCQVTFAQVLSRHGARDPTAKKTAVYKKLVNDIHANATSYAPGWEFIKNYNYTLGADELSVFGQQQMVNSGIKFYDRYQKLASKVLPFVRSAGQDRVVQSASLWTQGFHQALLADAASTASRDFPWPILSIPEDDTTNNTLNHALCTAFESGVYSNYGDDAQAKWVKVFTPAIKEKIQKALPGVALSSQDVISFLDLCPFNTVVNGTISPFCSLFTVDEWRQYDYYESVGKWYGYGPGNPLGSSNGVGWTNELLARLTNKPVVDHTSTNTTLDSSNMTFPLGMSLYADFTHDNDMMGILAALGVYNGTAPLSNTTITPASAANGYSASNAVAFASRFYIEKMTCGASGAEELVRVVVNDQVLPLKGCGADALGRCTLSSFVESQSFARGGGLWDQCFKK
jgi:hypothetical protein